MAVSGVDNHACNEHASDQAGDMEGPARTCMRVRTTKSRKVHVRTRGL